MASQTNISASSTGSGGFWQRIGRRWNWQTQDATAVGINGRRLTFQTNELNISARALAGRDGTARATGLLNSQIDFTGSRVNINTYAEGRDAYSLGLDGSKLNLLGNDNKLVSITATSRVYGYDPAWGLRNSSLSTGGGNDTIRIKADAATLSGNIFNSQILATGLERSQLSSGAGNDILSLEVFANGGRGKSSGSWNWNSSYSGNWSSNASGSRGGNWSWGYNNRWGSSTGNYGYQTSYRENYSSRYSYSSRGSYSYQDTDRRMGQAFGLVGSQVDLGSGNDQANLSIQGNDLARGLSDSQLTTGDGNDRLVLDVLANGEQSWSNSGSNSGAYSYSSRGFSVGTSAYWGNSSYRSPWGWNSSSSYLGIQQWNNSWDVNISSSWSNNWVNQSIRRFGTATGAQSSVLSLGAGDDSASIAVVGGDQASGLVGSSLDSGSGNDTIQLTVRAEGENSWVYRYENASRYRDQSVSNWSNSGISIGSYSNSYLGYYSSYGSYASKWNSNGAYTTNITSNYQQVYENASINRYGTAIGLDKSTLTSGDGNDTVQLEVTGGTEAIGLRQSLLNTGAGNDTITLTVMAEGETGYRYINQGSWSYDGSSSGKSTGNYSWASSYGIKSGWGNWSGAYSYSGSYAYQWNWSGRSASTWAYGANSGMRATGVATGLLNSQIDTGSGDDRILISTVGTLRDQALSNSSITTGDGNDSVVIDGDVVNSVIDGGSGNDQVVIMGGGSARIYGGAGNDSLLSSAGNTLLDGGEGNDVLIGGSGNDLLYGGLGDDLLEGGTGMDTLSGGSGRDTFVLNRGDGFSTVVDFQAGLDKVVIGISDRITAQYVNRDTLLYAGNDHLGTITNNRLVETSKGIWGSAPLPVA